MEPSVTHMHYLWKGMIYFGYTVFIGTILFIQIISITVLVSIVIPTIMHFFIGVFPKVINDGWKDMILITFQILSNFPVFSLLIGIVVQNAKSFIESLTNSLSYVTYITNIITEIENNGPEKRSVITKLILVVFFTFFVDLLFVIEFMNDKVLYSGILMIFIGFYPLINGLLRLFIASYKVLFYGITYNETTNELDSSLVGQESKATEKGDDFFPSKVFDPANLSNQKGWIAFVTDPKTNTYRNGVFGFWNIIVTIVVCINTVYTCIELIKLWNQMTKIVSYWTLICTIWVFIYFVMLVFSIPFCLFGNISTAFLPNNSFIGKGEINLYLKIMKIVYYILLGFGCFILILVVFWKPNTIPELEYVKAQSGNISKKQTLPSFCYHTTPGGLSFLQLVGLQTLTSLYTIQGNQFVLRNGTEKLLNNTLRYLFGEDFSLNSISIKPKGEKYLALLIGLENNPGIQFVALSSIDSIYSWAMFIETYIKVILPSVIGAIIPFFQFVKNIISFHIFFFSYFGIMSTTRLPHSDSISMSVYRMLNHSIKNVIIGHTIGGYIAKFVSSAQSDNSISFEGFPSVFSLNKLFFSLEEQFSTNTPPNKNMVLNIFTKNIFGVSDDDSSTNVVLKNFYSPMRIPNVYDTFCHLSSICSTDDTYLPFCNQILSTDGINGTQVYSKMLNFAKVFNSAL